MSLEIEINILKSKNLFYLTPNYLWTHFKVELNDRILVNLIDSLNGLLLLTQDNNAEQILNGLEAAFMCFYQEITQFLSLVDNQRRQSLNFMTNDEIFQYQRAILTQSLLPAHFNLLSLAFHKIFDLHNESTIEESNDFAEKFHSLLRCLFQLQLFDHLCSDIVVEVVQNKIRDYIESTSLDNYQESFISQFEQWLENMVIGWIRLIYVSSSQVDLNNTTDSFDQYLFNYKKQLAHFMYSHYARCRINRLFDIIVDYPDSKNAVDDLKVCLQKTNLRSTVIKSLKTSIEQRLLHPGVNTSDILTAYVSAIKALMILDPTGVMMENICEPLKRYLRNREDTVKCIVSSLIDESSSDIMEEFCKELYADDVSYGDSSAVSVFDPSKDWRKWTPDPIDANTINLYNEDSNKPDIISMLVNIYGSKDLFVNEYKTLLADRLLSNVSFNMEKEIRYLELLKLRFGDSNLFCCEAMLRDISESKRINSNVLEQLHQKGKINKNELNLKCIILSEQFWPKLKEESVELPLEIKTLQEKFTQSYEALKGNRTLVWKNNLGQITIDIDMGNGRIIECTVTPIQASVIMKFQEKDTWKLHELAQSLKMCSNGLRKKLLFWKNHGILQSEENDETENQVYTLVRDPNSSKSANRSKAFVEIEDENERVTHTNDQLRESDLLLYWNYTLNMLRGFGCLPLDRIHSLLKMYANSDITIEQVKRLLELKIKEQLVKYSAGLYRLNK